MLPTEEQLALDTVRAKVEELNAAIATAAKFDINVELETVEHFSLKTGNKIYVSAKITKTL